jgi:sugar lactone lactonase YvrE
MNCYAGAVSLTTTPVELVVDALASLGEGPVWDARRAELLWVDIDAGRVHRSSAATGRTRSFAIDPPATAVVPRAGGGFAAAVRDGFGVLDARSTHLQGLVPVGAGDADTRMNDGACDRRGRFWAGTLSYSRRPRGALFRWAGGAPERMLGGLTIANGIGWSPDDRWMFLVDTATGAIDRFAFDLDSGSIARRRGFATIKPAAGRPDGLAVDADGGVWVALWGGGAVLRFTADGILDRRIELPVSQVTSCCFGDADLGTLYVTTAGRGVDEPHAGGVFACRPGLTGLATFPFEG